MEDFEKKIIAANRLQADLLQKAMNGENLDSICKGKVAAMGEIRDWKGQKYQKTPGGWIPVKNQGGSKKEVEEDLKQRVENAQYKNNKDKIEGQIAKERFRLIQKYGDMHQVPAFDKDKFWELTDALKKEEAKKPEASEDIQNVSQMRKLILSGKPENIQRAKKIFDNLDTNVRDGIPKELTSKMGVERTNPERDKKNLEQSTKEFKELKNYIDHYGINERNVSEIVGRFNALTMTDDPAVEKKIRTWGKSLIKKQETFNKETHDRNQSTWDAAQKNPQSRKWPFGDTTTVESIEKKK